MTAVSRSAFVSVNSTWPSVTLSPKATLSPDTVPLTLGVTDSEEFRLMLPEPDTDLMMVTFAAASVV